MTGDQIDEVLEQLRELRREQALQRATLQLILDALRAQGCRVTALESCRLTPVPHGDRDDRWEP